MNAGVYYGNPIAVATVRRVWAALTRSPQAHVGALAKQIGLSPATVRCALKALKVAGYVDWEPGVHGARTIIVPFACIAAVRDRTNRPGEPPARAASK